MDKLPVTVIVCTRNEERNLKRCLEAVVRNNPAEIVVVDGESTDQTLKIAKDFNATTIVVKPKGLAFQRGEGLKVAHQPFISYVDGHDWLEDNCLSTLLHEMESNGYDAVQAQTFAYDAKTYWEKAADANTVHSINDAGPTNMVGRPCVYRADAIRNVGFDPFFGPGIGCEDVDVSIQFEQRGFKQGVGTGRCLHRHPNSFSAWFSKWKKYGRGDAHIIAKYPQKRKAIRRHQLIGYPWGRSINAIRAGGIIYVPFFVMWGLTRFFVSLRPVRYVPD